jgi:hypothetical protein
MAESPTNLWTGRVSFDGADLKDRSRFPDIRRIKRAEIRKIGNQEGRTLGSLRIESDGLRWKASNTPGCQLQGHFFLPWSIIDNLEVQKIPHKVNIGGGALVVTLNGSYRMFGEFIGSKKKLLRAIASTPVGPSGTLT